MARVGVLALQGGYAAHESVLSRLGHGAHRVRTPEDLKGLDGLIFPGGESSVHLKLIGRMGLADPLHAFVAAGHPVLGTCAGLILAARQVLNPVQQSMGWLDVAVTRNGYGRQQESFESVADQDGMPLLFIRAPRIVELGPGVEVLATHMGEPVMVRQGRITGAAFHPELTGDDRVHAQVFGRSEAVGGSGLIGPSETF